MRSEKNGRNSDRKFPIFNMIKTQMNSKKIRRCNHMGIISLYSWRQASCIGWFLYTRWRSTNQRWELFSTKWTLLFIELLFGLRNAWWRKNKNYESKLLLMAIESKVFIRKSNFKKVFRFASNSTWPRWVFTSPRWKSLESIM